MYAVERGSITGPQSKYNPMIPFFGYIRVSTPKQGQHGVSLSEQREAILRYASRNGLEIESWFEEQATAAKRGRPIFNRMLKLLRGGKAKGVVLHKIDRGARNLKDWADLGELIDSGLEVHFANESLDMHSRGGRLSADIQAVVAADYIRNLREETRKGFNGRLKQGIYPLGAPLGYLDKGGGKPKEIDPEKAPLVRQAFELYASCQYNLDTLGKELFRLGFRNKRGGQITRGGLAKLLKNPFYVGLIRLRNSGEIFSGVHQPIIPKSLFDSVQSVIAGKSNSAPHKHDYLFRRLLTCHNCGYHLIGERQRGYLYYRCHTKSCPSTGIREEAVTAEIERQLSLLRYSDAEVAYFRGRLRQLDARWKLKWEDRETAAKLSLAKSKDRLNRLTDAFLDGAIERNLFEERKAALLFEQKTTEENAAKFREQGHSLVNALDQFLELAGAAWLSYRMAIPQEKRKLLKTVTSNRELAGKNIVIKLSFPFLEVANRHLVSSGGLRRHIPRTWDRLFDILTAAYTGGQLPSLHPEPGCAEAS